MKRFNLQPSQLETLTTLQILMGRMTLIKCPLVTKLQLGNVPSARSSRFASTSERYVWHPNVVPTRGVTKLELGNEEIGAIL